MYTPLGTAWIRITVGGGWGVGEGVVVVVVVVGYGRKTRAPSRDRTAAVHTNHALDDRRT